MNNNSTRIMISEKIELFELNENSLYKNGYTLGKLYKNRINIQKYYQLKEKLYQKIEQKYSKLVFNIISKTIKKWISELKNNYSISIEDILGFSDALDIRDDVLLEINVIVEIYDYMCTLLGLISEENRWNLRILDLGNEFINIVKELDLPLSIIVNNVSDQFKYVMFGYIWFFNAHTSYINSSMITTFSWNKLELKDFLKNKIPPLFHIKYSFLKYKSIDNIYNYLINQNIIYDGYVMLMNKDKTILYDFDQNRNETKITTNENILISDFSFELNNNINDFINNEFNTIPSTLRCFSLIHDFKTNEFYINNNLSSKQFIKFKLKIT